jgi:hypothetical protein
MVSQSSIPKDAASRTVPFPFGTHSAESRNSYRRHSSHLVLGLDAHPGVRDGNFRRTVLQVGRDVDPAPLGSELQRVGQEI